MKGEEFPGRRLLRMAGVLLDRGHQLLRVTPFMAPSGMHWRLAIGTSGCPEVARYSSAQEDRFYDWPEAPAETPEGLATLFVGRFAALAAASMGEAPPYVEWYSRLLETVDAGWVPYFFDDSPGPEPESVRFASVGPRDQEPPLLPFPPAG